MAAQKKLIRKRPKPLARRDHRAEHEGVIKDERVSSDELLARVVIELVRMRMRHRALIKTLKNGEFDWESYKSYIESVEESDAEALFHLIVMKWDAFREKYGHWMTEDFAEFGFKRTRGVKSADVEALQPSEDVKA